MSNNISKSDLQRFADYGVATVYEAAGRVGLIDIPLTQLIPGSKVAGPARTVLCGQDDNLMVHAVLDQVQPGEILVLTMTQPQAIGIIGELLATQAKVHQVAGILVDAAVRDTEAIRELGLPVWTRWIRSRGATKTLRGSINIPVSIGGTSIAPGDIVILDADGAVSVAASQAEQVLADSRAREERETILRAKLQAGALSYDLHGLRALFEQA